MWRDFVCRILSQTELSERGKFFHPSHNEKIGRFVLNNDFANIQYEYFNADCGINLVIFKGFCKEDTQAYELDTSLDKSISYINFNLGENMLLSKEKQKLSFDKKACYHGSFNTHGKSFTQYEKGKSYSCVQLSFEDDRFSSLFRDKKTKSIFQSDDFTLNFHNHINPNQQILLRQILNQPYDINDTLSQIFLESKLLELIYVTANIKQDDKNKPLSSDDIKCIYRAKEILLSDIVNPPSLEELARASATNTFKLKRGFKQVFGTTAYALLRQHRLNKAKELLENGDINISEAAKLTGYKHISNFSQAFKEHFGIRAIEVKKKYT